MDLGIFTNPSEMRLFSSSSLIRSYQVWNFYENVNQDNDETNTVGLRVKMADTKKTVQPSLTVRALQTAVDTWIKTYGVRYFAEMTNLAVLMEEVGELARIISRTYGEQSFKANDRATDLGDELADVLFVLVCIANQTGVDLEAAISRNLQKKTAPGQPAPPHQSEIERIAQLSSITRPWFPAAMHHAMKPSYRSRHAILFGSKRR